MSRAVERADGDRLHSSRIDKPGPILVIHWGRAGGGPRFAVRMAEALRAAWPGELYTSLNAQAEIVGLDDTHVSNDLPVVTYRSVWGLILGAPRIVLLGIRLRRLLKRHGVKTVYSAMSSLWQTICISLFLPRDVRFLASIHDAAEHPGEEHWALRLCRRLDLRRADVVVVHSGATRDALLPQPARGSAPVMLVPHGADLPTGTQRRLDASGDRAIVLGFVGRIVEYKGLDLFVDLIRSLSAGGMNVRGIVAGHGEVPEGLLTTTHALIDWRIGWIPESDLPRVMDEIDVLVLPYREASQSGMHALALSAGVPTVATPVGGLIEQIRESAGGVVAEEVSVKALGDAVRRQVDPPRYERTSAQCLSAAAGSHSWGHAASVFVDAVTEIALTGSSPMEDA